MNIFNNRWPHMKFRRQLSTLMLVGTLMGSSAYVSTGYSSCITPEEKGAWVNYDPDTRSITQVDVRFQCQDLVLNGELYPPGDPYYIHLWGSCSPTDCDWEEQGATRDSNGWIRTTIDHGFATRYVWVKAYTGYTLDWLRVWIWTDFDDPGRADYASDDWFLRR